MSESGHEHADSFEARHAAIIARTLRWADELAERGDYVEALRWVEKVRSLGQTLPGEYEAKRQAWLQAVERGGTESKQGSVRNRRRSASG